METIRSERPADTAAVRTVHEAAFPTSAEANLVDLLRDHGNAVVSLIAEADDRVVGHIIFSPVTLDPPVRGIGLGLGPVAVLPEFEHHGVGRRLIQNGLAECRARGAGFVVVVGEPVYYGRFGFERASGRGLNNEYGVDEAFMVFELEAGALPRFGGLVKYGPEFAALPKS